jgi:ribosomal protein S18 acetylase RimI-like enzyme
METYKKATTTQYEEFFNLMLEHMADYIEILMERMGMSIEEFHNLLKTLGQVYSINSLQGAAGYYWVEERGDEIHLHGIVLKETHQGQGTGTRTLIRLAEKYLDEKAFIELGVHRGNKRAIKLYEKLGYQTVAVKEDLDFNIMRKNLQSNAYKD